VAAWAGEPFAYDRAVSEGEGFRFLTLWESDPLTGTYVWE
jgi:hypothetical protein